MVARALVLPGSFFAWWELWPIASAVLVACIFVFLGLELLAHLMGPKEQTQGEPEIWSDGIGKRLAYALTALVLLFVALCVVFGITFFVGWILR